MRILFFLFLSIHLMGQTPPRVTFKQIQRDTLTGSIAISGIDSNLIYSRDIIIANNKLVVFGDTVGQGGGLASVLVDSVTIYGNGLNTALYVDTNYIKNMIGFFTIAGLGVDVTYDSTNKQLLIESLGIEDSVYNGTASTIAKGTPLYAIGSQGNYWSVAPADASDINKLPVIAIASNEILAGETGIGLIKGHIKQVNTTGLADGDEVYVGVGGGYTNTKPKGENNYIQRLGTVIKGNSANGSGIINLGEIERNLNPQKIFIGANDSTIITVNLSDSLASKADVSHTHTIANVTALQDSISNKLNTNLGNINGTLQEANGGTGETTYTNGQLLIGNTSTGGLDKATLTAGANVTITNGGGSITIASTGGGGSSFNNLTETADTVFVAKYLNVDTATLYVDADNNQISIGSQGITPRRGKVQIYTDVDNNPLHITGNTTGGGVAILQNFNNSGYSGFNVFDSDDTLRASLAYGNKNAPTFANELVFSTRQPSTELVFYQGGQFTNNERLRFKSDSTIVFSQGVNPRMTIAEGGKVGIGTTTPSELFALKDTTFLINDFGDIGVNSSLDTVNYNTALINMPNININGNLKANAFTAIADSSIVQIGGAWQVMDFRFDSDDDETRNMNMRLWLNSDNATNRPAFAFRKTRGNFGAHLPVQAEDVVGAFGFQGSDSNGSVGQNSADISVRIDGSVGVNSVPMRIGFRTGTWSTDIAERLTIKSDGLVGIGTTTPAYLLELPNVASNTGGRGRANQWATYSDGRIKSNKEELPYGINDVMMLEPLKYYHHNSRQNNELLEILPDGETTIGFIAQDVLSIIPELVSLPSNYNKDLYSMDYAKLTVILTKAIQEQQAIINQQQSQINDLLQRIINLENK
jgi:hypothetical protein